MKYELENCSAELTFEKEPMVTFVFHGTEQRNKYFASQVISCASKVDSFTVSSAWDDEMDRIVGAYDIHLLAGLISKELTPSIGRYELVWVPNDPSLPF